MSHAFPVSLLVLHYLAPFLITFSAATLSSLAACFVPPSSRLVQKKRSQSVCKWLSLSICGSYATEGILYAQRAIHEPHSIVSRDSTAYLTLSALVWTVTFIILRESDTLYWPACLGTWVFGTVLEIIIWVLQDRSRSDYFSIAQIGPHILRLLCMVSLILVSTLAIFSGSKGIDMENKPLLGPESTAFKYGKPCGTSYPEDTDQHGDEQQLLGMHIQRLEQLGGWWEYLKKYRVFLPYLIPHTDFKMQCYIVGTLLCIIVGRVTNVLGPRYLGIIVDKLSANQDAMQLPLKEICVLIFAIRIPHDEIINRIRHCLGIRLYYWSYRQLMVSSYSRIMGLSLEFHANKDTGEVLRGINQAQTLNHFVNQLVLEAFPALIDLVVAIGYLSHLFDFQLGMMILVTSVFYVIVTYKCTTFSAHKRRKYLRSEREHDTVLYETVSNWQSVTYFNRQAHEVARLQATTKSEIQAMTKFSDLSQYNLAAQGLVLVLGYGAVLLLGSYEVSRNGRPVGNMVTLLMYWGILTRPVFSLAQQYKDVIGYVVDGERLLQLWHQMPHVSDAPDAPDIVVAGGRIEFQNVTFSYGGHNAAVHGITFTAELGSTVGIVGETGSGKSTICNKLLLRLYDVAQGRILIDGQDLRDVSQHSLREAIGVVPQDVSFPNQTIMDIVRYARLEATDGEIHEACKAAAIHDRIMSYPNKYQSKVGERGVKLSGGEKQRIAIAQLFLKRPKIFVLDEATSAMDPITELRIQESFAKLTAGRTTIIVAHRLSTIMHADLIIVLDKGEIIEQGTHEELLGEKGKYYQLWQRKSKDEPLAEPSHQTSDTEFATPVSGFLNMSKSDRAASTLIDPMSQFDGQSESKNMKGSNPTRSSSRKRLHKLKAKLATVGEPDEDLEVEDAPDNDAPIRLISPRATSSSVPVVKHRRSFGLSRKPRYWYQRSSFASAQPSSSRNPTARQEGSSPIQAPKPKRAVIPDESFSGLLEEARQGSRKGTEVNHPHFSDDAENTQTNMKEGHEDLGGTS